MAAYRLPHVSIGPRTHKVKPVPSGNDIINIDTPSSAELYRTSKQSNGLQSTLLSTEEMANDTKQTKKPPSFPSFASDNQKTISDENSLIPKVESTKNRTKVPKLLIVAIGIGIIIALAALAALSIGIYTLVQMSETTTASTTTISLGLLWSTMATTVAGTGVSGNQVNEMGGPWHIAFDSAGALYVADQGYNRVQKWIIGKPIATIVAGQVNGQASNTMYYLTQPYGVYIDLSGNIYVADTNNHRVQLWASGGSPVTTVAGNCINGSASNQLNGPSSLTLDLSSSKLYIADTGNHRIMSYASGASTGIVVAGGIGPGTLMTQLYSPSDVYFDSSTGSLFIANSGAHNIIQWVVGASTWSLVAGYSGNYGSTSFMLNNPIGLTLDSVRNLYVADKGNARVQLFRSGEANGTTIAGVTSTPGNRANLLNNPRSVALDDQLNLYVSDSSNNRIQMFERY